MTNYASKNKVRSTTTSPKQYPQGWFKDKECRLCHTLFSPQSPSSLYCSNECAKDGYTSAYLQRNYKMDIHKYRSLLKDQKALCAICYREGFVMAEHHKLKLVVDHCHASGKVRGLLCQNCNRALGLLADNTEWLENAITYLRK